MKIHGTATGGAIGKKDFGVAFGGGAASDYPDGLGDDADLVVSGSVNFQQSGKVGDYSLQFTGGKGTMTLSSGLDLSSAVTFSMWVNNASWAGAGSTSQVFISATTTGSIYMNIMDINNKKIKTEGVLGTMFSGVLALDTWYNLVLTNDGTNSSLWVNGVEVATSTGAAGSFTTFVFAIDGTLYPFSGFADSFGLWTRVITDAEIGELYNSGTGAAVNSISTADLKVYYNFEQSSSPITNQAIP